MGNVNLLNNFSFRSFDPENVLQHKYIVTGSYRIHPKVIMINHFSFRYISNENINKNLENNPYKNDLIFLTDTTQNTLTTKEPSFLFTFRYSPGNHLIFFSTHQYKIGKTTNKVFPFGENIHFLFENSLGIRWHLNNYHHFTGSLSHGIYKEKISISDIEDAKPVYLRRFRGLFKYREHQGGINHTETISRFYSTSSMHNTVSQYLSHTITLHMGFDKSNPYDRYQGTNFPDYKTKTKFLILSDSIIVKFLDHITASVNFFYNGKNQQLVSPSEQILAVKTLRHFYGAGIGFNHRFGHLIEKIHYMARFGTGFEKYTDYLADANLSQDIKKFYFETGFQLKIGKVSPNLSVYYQKYISGDKIQLYYPTFSTFGIHCTIKSTISPLKPYSLSLIYSGFNQKSKKKSGNFIGVNLIYSTK